ncbi:EndoU domain-containing protein [Saccharopolyspora pogona]|uniref:EndoU domain-containing protein n=1 Tax=Saccharopolyspora pogona TaxID=333966 RepID=UPI0016871BE8|nr:EndoU domain-containing protein [Saccharopolyspora pogona]
MSAVEDVDKALSFVLGKLAEATEQLSTAQAALEESVIDLSVLDSTNDDEAQQALAYHKKSGDQLTHAQQVLHRCTEQIKQYQPRVATSPTPSTPPRGPTARPDRTRSSVPCPAWDNVAGEKPNLADVSAEPRRNYILDGDGLGGGGHVAGTGLPNKMEFPKAWDDDQIINSIEDVAKNPDRPPELQENGRWRVEGTRDGVDIRVVVDKSGQVRTAHPVGGEGVIQNDVHGNPIPTEPKRR